MEIYIFVFFIIILIVFLTFAIITPIYKNHIEATANIINYDYVMRKFVFKVYLSRTEILRKLSEQNEFDELNCKVDSKQSAITIFEYGSSIEYTFHIQENDGFSILRLEQIQLFGMSNHICYKLNPYILRKLNCELVPFSEYSF